eukprot:5122718-Amphidinium_carterae.1
MSRPEDSADDWLPSGLAASVVSKSFTSQLSSKMRVEPGVEKQDVVNHAVLRLYGATREIRTLCGSMNRKLDLWQSHLSPTVHG